MIQYDLKNSPSGKIATAWRNGYFCAKVLHLWHFLTPRKFNDSVEFDMNQLIGSYGSK